MVPLYHALIRRAAQMGLFIIDDTVFRIIDHERANSPPLQPGAPKKKKEKNKKRAVFCSGIVGKDGDETICLFQTNPGHAGEFLGELLGLRAAGLPAPLQMADALSSNVPKGYSGEVVRGKCLDHARRKFYEIQDSCPQEWEHAWGLFKAIYKNDGETKKKNMSPSERLAYHQKHSQVPFDDLSAWCKDSLAAHRIEPNSGCGKAMQYFNNHTQELSAFLRAHGMPLSSAEVERLIKRMVSTRKNSLQYKSQRGATYGDAVMSLLLTCAENGISPHRYLEKVLSNADAVMKSPADWLPLAAMTSR